MSATLIEYSLGRAEAINAVIPYAAILDTASHIPDTYDIMSEPAPLFFTLPQERTRPFLGKLESMRLRYQRSLRGWGRGSHVSRYAGSGMEFREFRDYAQGDDTRKIDWKTSARFDRPYVRTYQQDESRFAHILIDNSRSMSKVPSDRKLDAARDIGTALGYLALCSDDPAEFSSFPSPDGLPLRHRCTNRSRIGEMHDFMNTLTGQGELNLPQAASEILKDSRGRHGTVVVISDFLFAENAYQHALKMLLRGGLQVAAIQVIGESELQLPDVGEDVVQVSDSETGRLKRVQVTKRTQELYRQAISTHQHRLRSFCYSMRVWFASFTYTESKGAGALEEFVLQQLPGMGFLRGKV